MNSREFAAQIKAQYPDYADVPDVDLARAMLAKYPEYHQHVDTSDLAPAPVQAAPVRATPPQAAPEQVSTARKVLSAAFPDVVRSAEAGSKAPIWSGIRSGLTLPARAAYGGTQALAELAGSGSPRQALDVLQRTMEDPEKAAQDIPGRVQSAAAGMINDPMLLPSLAVPGGSAGRMALRGARLGGQTYVSHALDRYTRDQPDVLTGETAGQALADVAPAVLPVAGAIGARVLPHIPVVGAVPNVVSNLASMTGDKGKEMAYKLARSIVKPLPAARNRQVSEGFEQGIRGMINFGAGPEPVFPQIITRETHSVDDILANYRALKERVDAGFEPSLKALEEAGVVVPPKAISNAVAEHMRNVNVGTVPTPGKVGAMTPETRDAAVETVRNLVEKHHGNLPMQDLMEAFGKTETTPVPAAYAVRDIPRGTDKLRTRQMTPTEYANAAVDEGLREPETTTDAIKRWLEQHQAYGREPDAQLTVHSSVEPLYKMPIAPGQTELAPMERAFDFPALNPRRAAELKSQAQNEAYRRTAEQDLPREEALRKAGEELKAWLTDPEKSRAYAEHKLMNPELYPQYTPEDLRAALLKRNVVEKLMQQGMTRERAIAHMPSMRGFMSPQRTAAHAQYAKQLENAAPIYKLEESLERAETRAANRNPVSLPKAAVNWVTNPIRAFQVSAQEDPAMARLIYDIADYTGRIPKPIRKVGTGIAKLQGAASDVLQRPQAALLQRPLANMSDSAKVLQYLKQPGDR